VINIENLLIHLCKSRNKTVFSETAVFVWILLAAPWIFQVCASSTAWVVNIDFWSAWSVWWWLSNGNKIAVVALWLCVSFWVHRNTERSWLKYTQRQNDRPASSEFSVNKNNRLLRKLYPVVWHLSDGWQHGSWETVAVVGYWDKIHHPSIPLSVCLRSADGSRVTAVLLPAVDGVKETLS